MSLCQLLFARGRYKHEYFLSALWQFYFLLFFYIETVYSFFLHSLLKFYSKQKFVWFCYLVVFIYQHFTFFANSYLFYLVLLLKITLFNTVHSDGKNLTRL